MKRIKTWFIDLSRVGKVSALAALALGGIFTVSAMSPPPPNTAPSEQTIEAPVEKSPVVTMEKEIKTEIVPFKQQTAESDSLAKGTTKIQTYGVNGEKTIIYTITLTDGVETNRTSLETITTQPIDEVTLVGTYVEPIPTSNCDPNYSGCVPIASDVDCGGGSGNGPEYVYGAVQVIGSDIYGLDRDGDGWGCE